MDGRTNCRNRINNPGLYLIRQRTNWYSGESRKYNSFSDSYPSYRLVHVLVVSIRTYFIVASKRVRPGHIYKVAVNILKADHSVNIRASIQRDGVELASDHKRVQPKVPEVLLLKVGARFDLVLFTMITRQLSVEVTWCCAVRYLPLVFQEGIVWEFRVITKMC